MSPYSEDAYYYHHRLKDSRSFDQKSFRTISIRQARNSGLYKGEKFMNKPFDNKAVIGYNNYTRRVEVQKILEKK
jgi:hypothetical protein